VIIVAEVTLTRGPLTARGDTGLFNVILHLTAAEGAALDGMRILEGDLTAAFTTVDFLPRLVRRRGYELGIDYTTNATTPRNAVGELCRLAVEARLSPQH
jgi:hypothetical protein